MTITLEVMLSEGWKWDTRQTHLLKGKCDCICDLSWSTLTHILIFGRWCKRSHHCNQPELEPEPELNLGGNYNCCEDWNIIPNLTHFVSHHFCTIVPFISNISSSEEATLAIQEGKEQLKMLQRQAIIGNLYPSSSSVMESSSWGTKLAWVYT